MGANERKSERKKSEIMVQERNGERLTSESRKGICEESSSSICSERSPSTNRIHGKASYLRQISTCGKVQNIDIVKGCLTIEASKDKEPTIS